MEGTGLTRSRVEELGLDRVAEITADMIEGFTSIEGNAFYGCRGLRSIELPSSIVSIGDSAFCGCSCLTSVTIPNSVKIIGLFAFDCCHSLTSVTIPNSVTSIGYYAFSRCRSLTSVTIPDSVTRINSCAFSHCKFNQKKKTDKQGRIIAYKGFKSDLTYRGFQYKEGKLMNQTLNLGFVGMAFMHA